MRRQRIYARARSLQNPSLGYLPRSLQVNKSQKGQATRFRIIFFSESPASLKALLSKGRAGRGFDSAPWRIGPRLQALHLSRDLSRRRPGSGSIMAAEEADVDIEGDVVPVAAQSGWGVETGSCRDEEGRRCEEGILERSRFQQGPGERKTIRWARVS